MGESTIVTGQYVQIDQTPASLGYRLLARCIDFLLIIVYAFACFAVISVLSDWLYYWSETTGYLLLALLLLPAIGYSLLWELLNQGQTPGKKIMGIRVVMKDGTKPTMSAYLLRWIFLMVDIHLIQYIGVLTILLTKNKQRLGDLAAGTLVIKEKNYHKIQVTLDEFRHLGVDYQPVFIQAENLSLEQINLINETLSRNDSKRLVRIGELGQQARHFLAINPPVSNEAFLQTLLRDYQYYALEDI